MVLPSAAKRRTCVPGTWGRCWLLYPLARRPCPFSPWCFERPRSARWFDWDGERSRPFRLVTASRMPSRLADPVGTAGAPCRLPPPGLFSPAPLSPRPPMVVPNTSAARRALQEATRQAKAAAEMAALPVHNPHAAGIDVGDATHWACVGSTPDGPDTVREFPA